MMKHIKLLWLAASVAGMLLSGAAETADAPAAPPFQWPLKYKMIYITSEWGYKIKNIYQVEGHKVRDEMIPIGQDIAPAVAIADLDREQVITLSPRERVYALQSMTPQVGKQIARLFDPNGTWEKVGRETMGQTWVDKYKITYPVPAGLGFKAPANIVFVWLKEDDDTPVKVVDKNGERTSEILQYSPGQTDGNAFAVPPGYHNANDS